MASGNAACSFSIFEIAKLFLEKIYIATIRWQTKSIFWAGDNCNVNAASLTMLASTKVSLKKITFD